MVEISIHNVKSITSEIKHFKKNDQHEAFSMKEIIIIDEYGIKTTISLYADTNQELDII